ncbi:MAG: 3-hydroxyacyl-ACP dehydratase [Bacteroidetes bacterium]|jgi:predicted hotdog family 3-hydroxylacyl-ACP dehydratase|nr:3-hydroxyacyl-ACP dehydratase [Bacteroidota bacterium]MBP7256296.1 3-hydroxyacyl-ACP dehydratase [Chitinophagales bacterium]MBK7138601.1 3-hydroxyacyl-ACP dehydratase [Bacteroidota bacterium]MBK7503911.1 3-hydroxyacyl-ACP dehydratase [Bacteroidota bacterium]MBK7639003.1 3-hydroxyacyl-ACP dehydratase [Bacteroidota bacterium]
MINNTLDSLNVLEVLPQRPPMVMIDRLLFVDTKKTISTFFIDKDCIFCNKAFLNESGIVENIAQTGAAGFGYLDFIAQKPILLGFIASIKNLIINQLPPIGQTLITEVVVEDPVMGFNIIKGKILLNELEIASCEMRIFINKTEQNEK